MHQVEPACQIPDQKSFRPGSKVIVRIQTHTVVERRKKAVRGTTPRRRDFDAVYYMGSTTTVGEIPAVTMVIRALDTHTYTGLIALPGPLKWSVRNVRHPSVPR